MNVQTINFSNPKDMSTNIFRVVRLRFFKTVVEKETVIQSDREEPDEVYLCTSLNRKAKTRNYEWMTKREVKNLNQWEIYETSSIQKARDLVADNRIYFLNMEATLNQSRLFTFGPVAYILPTHGHFIMMRIVFVGPRSMTEYMQITRDETTVVTTNLPYHPQHKHVHWTRTPERASKMEPMSYAYLAFIAEICSTRNQQLCAPPEQYKFRYVNESLFVPYAPSPMCLTLLSAMAGEPPASRPSDLDIDESTSSTSTPIEEMVSCLDPTEQARQMLLSSATEIERKHASSYLELEQTLYQQAEKVIDLMCRESLPPAWEDIYDPVTEMDLEAQYSEYEKWWASLPSSVEQPALQQIPHSCSSSVYAEQMHSEGLLVSTD